MNAVIADPDLERSLIRRRRARGEDRHDEVWEGICVMNAQPNDEHQFIVSHLTFIFEMVIGERGLGQIRPGTNISDRNKDWKDNYRCPDVAVFLNDSTAINRRTLELYRLTNSQLTLVAKLAVDSPDSFQTETVPLHWRLVSGPHRPLLEATVLDGAQHWLA